MERIVLFKDESRIQSIIRAHDSFASYANEILSLVPSHYPALTFEFDARYLLKMFRNELPLSVNALGISRYRKILEESEIRQRFGNDGLTLDVAKALEIFSLPDFSPQLAHAFSECYNGLNSSIQIENFQVNDDLIEFSQESKGAIEARYSHVIEGIEAEQYRKFEAIVKELNKLVNDIYGEGTYIPVETLLQVNANDKGNPEIQIMPSCVPSQRQQLIAARVAMGAGMMKSENPMANPHVAARHILGKPDTSDI